MSLHSGAVVLYESFLSRILSFLFISFINTEYCSSLTNMFRKLHKNPQRSDNDHKSSIVIMNNGRNNYIPIKKYTK